MNHIIISKKMSLYNVIFYILLISLSMENRRQLLRVNLICFQSDYFVRLTVGETLRHENFLFTAMTWNHTYADTSNLRQLNTWRSPTTKAQRRIRRKSLMKQRFRVIPCQINRWFPLTPSDSFEILHTCRNCLETNTRQFFFNLGQASSEIWVCEKMKK